MNIIARHDETRKPAFYVPKNLSSKMLPAGQRQLAAHFLNLLHWKWICWQADEQKFVHLKTEYLLRIIPQDVWPSLRTRLEALGVIEVDDHWIRGRQSKGYRITPDYWETRRVECSDPKLARRIERVWMFDSVPWLPVHRHLWRQFNRLEIDLDRTDQIIQTLVPDEPAKISLEQYRHILREQCTRLHHGDHELRVDRFGRVHTIVTRTAKELRCCLSLDGQPLVGLDLANCQPLLAGVIARQWQASRKRADRLYSRTYSVRANPYHRRQPERCEAMSADLVRYLDLCQRGEIYESLMQPGDTRDEVKRAFLTAFYGKDNWSSRLMRTLAAEYPTITGMLSKIKKHDHRRAAHLLQNVESTLFIGGIATRLAREHPTVPILTIHDSVWTIPEYLTLLERIILEEFARIGIQPTLKKEH